MQHSEENSDKKQTPTHLINMEIYSLLMFEPAIIFSISSNEFIDEVIISMSISTTAPIDSTKEYSELYLLRNIASTDVITDIAQIVTIFKIRTPA